MANEKAVTQNAVIVKKAEKPAPETREAVGYDLTINNLASPDGTIYIHANGFEVNCNSGDTVRVPAFVKVILDQNVRTMEHLKNGNTPTITTIKEYNYTIENIYYE